MNEALARVDVDTRPDRSRTTVRVVGEIDLSNAGYLEERLDDAVRLGARLVLDLTSLTYLDSQGVRVIHRLVERHQQGLVDLTIVAARCSVAGSLLAITRVADAVRVVEPPDVPAQ